MNFSLFAWCDDANAKRVAQVMTEACKGSGTTSDVWVSRIDAPGARLIAEDSIEAAS